MRMLCAILESTSGEVFLNGKDVVSMGADYRNVLGYLPQDFGYYPGYTAMEFLMYVSALKGIPKKIARKRAEELLEEVGLSRVADKKVKTFSGGMKQRVGIAQALLNSPDILILDEPTAGLDPKERVRFRNLLSDYAGDKIVILSTHIVSDVEAIADEVLLMKDGKFVLQGTVPELTRKVEGKVWELTVSPAEAKKWQAESTVANLRHEGHQIVLRIISEGILYPELRDPGKNKTMICYVDPEKLTGLYERRQKALDLIPLAGSAADIFRTNTFHVFGKYIWSPYLLITVPVLIGILCMPLAVKGWSRRLRA